MSAETVQAAGSNKNVYTANVKVAPRTIPGTISESNRGACDWGWQSLFAYGCNKDVVVIDVVSFRVLQTLIGHSTNVVKVKWSLENYHHSIGSPYSLRLASADLAGNVIIWNVYDGSIMTRLGKLGNGAVGHLEWFPSQQASRDLLAVLHLPSTLVLWNANTGTSLWQKVFHESLKSFAFDPFDHSNVLVLAQDHLVHVTDFSTTHVPGQVNSPVVFGIQSNTVDSPSPEVPTKSRRFLIKVPNMSGKGKTSNKSDSGKRQSAPDIVTKQDETSLSGCLQALYSPACRHYVYIVYHRLILIFDLEMKLIIGHIKLDRSTSPLMQVYPCRQRNVLFCLHENGSIAMRVRRASSWISSFSQDSKFNFVESLLPSHSSSDVNITSDSTNIKDDNADETVNSWASPEDIAFDMCCQTDSIRITKSCRVIGFCCFPVTESDLVLVLSDGRLLKWRLMVVHEPTTKSNLFDAAILDCDIFANSTSLYTLKWSKRDENSKEAFSLNEKPRFCLSDMIAPHFHIRNSTDDQQANLEPYLIDVKMTLTGCCGGVAPKPTCHRMCPPLTTKNLTYYQPLIAVGSTAGYVQIFNLSNGSLVKEFCVLTVPIKGIDWIGETRLLAFGHSTSSNNNTYRNEIVILDLRNGYVAKVRDYNNEASAVEAVKVSHLKQYFIVMFKDRPLEIWDLHSGSLIRDMPKNFPYPTCLVWYSSSGKKRLQSSSDASTSADSEGSIINETSGQTQTQQLLQQGTAMEHFVYISSDNVLYHFMIHGNTIKDGSKIPGGGGVGTVNDMTWKNDLIIMGDTDGSFIVWDLKARLSRIVPAHRGSIRKLRISPGKGNLKVALLLNDGIDIWDAQQRENLFSLKINKGGSQIIDIDWVTSDKTVVLYEDGSIRILDSSLNLASSPVPSNDTLPYTTFNAYLIQPKVALLVKQLLQHQPWNEIYELRYSEFSSKAQNQQLVTNITQQLSILPDEVTDMLLNSTFGTAQRCLLTARLFGDQSENDFWTVALHYLRKAHLDPRHSKKLASHIDSDQKLTSHIESDIELTSKGNDYVGKGLDVGLDTKYDLLRNRKIFRKDQLERTFLYDSKRSSCEQTNKCECNLILLGQVDRAIQLLLETDPNDENYYADSLRACLAATICTSGAAQSTVKLVATNLIANGRLFEGVQLLCLIGKNLDACRYLQTYGEWYKAAWLAKATLSTDNCYDIYRHWIENLLNSTQEDHAILVALSLCDFQRVMELLSGLRLYDRAVLFLEACLEFQVLDVESDPNLTHIKNTVYSEYARYCMQLDNEAAAEYYQKQMTSTDRMAESSN